MRSPAPALDQAHWSPRSPVTTLPKQGLPGAHIHPNRASSFKVFPQNCPNGVCTPKFMTRRRDGF